MAHVDKTILKEGYGCEVSLVPGDTVPTLTSMAEKSEPDIAPEVWVNNSHELLAKGVEEGRLVYATEVLIDGGDEGWWIPKYVQDANPDIVSIEDALERPDLFKHPEYPDIGAVYGCPSGWACQYINENLFRAYGGEEMGFKLVDPGSSAGLDGSLAGAYEQGDPWLGYYWAPSALLSKYEMFKLAFGVNHDADLWATCTARVDCADPKPNAWTDSTVYTVVTSRFAEASTDAFAYIKKRGWSNSTINKVLAYMHDNQFQGEDAAEYFFEKYKDLWTTWVSDEVAMKVKSAL